MHLFDSNCTITKYVTLEQILEEFFHIRLEFHEKRKLVLLDNLEMKLLKLENKFRFYVCGCKRREHYSQQQKNS